MLIDLFTLVAGLVALYFGAEWLVRGASRLAFAMGVRPLVIGLTVVGFGTSMPEVVVAATASWNGHAETALGTVLGSNIANTGLILAIAALITPMQTDLRLMRREAPIMVAVALAVYLAGLTGLFPRWSGLLMLAALGGFVWLSLRWAKSESPKVEAEFREFEQEQHLLERGARGKQIALVVAGIALLIVGGNLLVESGTNIATALGVPQIVIAATLLAVGTSLPELATSVLAAMRKEGDIAVGNIVGSNIFNLLGVLGTAAAVNPIEVSERARHFELPAMVGFMAATYVVLGRKQLVTRAEGAWLLLCYGLFIALLLAR